jgi:hypothetical protein
MAMRGRVGLVAVTIANGTALSAGVKISDDEQIAAVVMPSAWTAANVTFQASVDGGTTWRELHNGSGAVQVTGTASAQLAVTESDFRSVMNVKVRSGTSGVPVNQGADRVLYLVTVARP